MVDSMAGLHTSARDTSTRDENVADRHVQAVTNRLAEEFGGTASDLEHRVRSEFSRWDNARVTQFVPVFVERTVRAELRRR
jgi:hypothetical protein